jgi:FkbM family methyltransferase
MFYGLNNIDEKLSKYFDFERGCFFEAGANDGVSQSNTLYFEESRGWHGVLVEPHPEKFMECVVNRRKAIVEWGALVPPDWESEYVELTFCNLMTVTKNSWPDPIAEYDHIQQGLKVFKTAETSYDFRALPWTISAVLDKHRVERVDFMSIDLEGFELQALRGLDFNRHRPTWLLVEERQPEKLMAFLKPYYDFIEQLARLDFLFKLKG